MENEKNKIKYGCDQCGLYTYLYITDVFRCNNCGYRILYKSRTKKIISYRAR